MTTDQQVRRLMSLINKGIPLATAAAIPGTLVNLAAGGGERSSVRFGHPSGSLRVGAEAAEIDGAWAVRKVSMSRSARRLMSGEVWIPPQSSGGSPR